MADAVPFRRLHSLIPFPLPPFVLLAIRHGSVLDQAPFAPAAELTSWVIPFSSLSHCAYCYAGPSSSYCSPLSSLFSCPGSFSLPSRPAAVTVSSFSSLAPPHLPLCERIEPGVEGGGRGSGCEWLDDDKPNIYLYRKVPSEPNDYFKHPRAAPPALLPTCRWPILRSFSVMTIQILSVNPPTETMGIHKISSKKFRTENCFAPRLLPCCHAAFQTASLGKKLAGSASDECIFWNYRLTELNWAFESF